MGRQTQEGQTTENGRVERGQNEGATSKKHFRSFLFCPSISLSFFLSPLLLYGVILTSQLRFLDFAMTLRLCLGPQPRQCGAIAGHRNGGIRWL